MDATCRPPVISPLHFSIPTLYETLDVAINENYQLHFLKPLVF